jgi:hypothetical protein
MLVGWVKVPSASLWKNRVNRNPMRRARRETLENGPREFSSQRFLKSRYWW